MSRPIGHINIIAVCSNIVKRTFNIIFLLPFRIMVIHVNGLLRNINHAHSNEMRWHKIIGAPFSSVMQRGHSNTIYMWISQSRDWCWGFWCYGGTLLHIIDTNKNYVIILFSKSNSKNWYRVNNIHVLP